MLESEGFITSMTCLKTPNCDIQYAWILRVYNMPSQYSEGIDDIQYAWIWRVYNASLNCIEKHKIYSMLESKGFVIGTCKYYKTIKYMICLNFKGLQ